VIKPNSKSTKSKKEQIQSMFNIIAPTYDTINKYMTLNSDKSWRKKVSNIVYKKNVKSILDVATGTGDIAFEMAKDNVKIIAIDNANEMLEIAKEKSKDFNTDSIIDFQLDDAENLTFSDNSFDAVTVGFGVRNFEDLKKGLSEMYRVLKPDGQIVILETAVPQTIISKIGYFLHTNLLIPFLGLVIAKNSNAYKYLSKSAKNFPHGERFKEILNETGFCDVAIESETFGVVNIYSANKLINN
tara:strand:+ start:1940 stop:2668 length:729 start_codon:yes stop_codon:yes gene_type:complete